jgi:hypothetical protein
VAVLQERRSPKPCVQAGWESCRHLSTLSTLSFRAKLLLVLLVPFLALVVVAGAGLRDRFVAFRA